MILETGCTLNYVSLLLLNTTLYKMKCHEYFLSVSIFFFLFRKLVLIRQLRRHMFCVANFSGIRTFLEMYVGRQLFAYSKAVDFTNSTAVHLRRFSETR